MLHQPITYPQDVRDALDDVAMQIDTLKQVTARLQRSKVGSRAFEQDRAYASDLVSQIGSRAARVESTRLDADGLLAIANGIARGAKGQPSRITSRTLREEYERALARERTAIDALSAAQQERENARCERDAAEQVMNAYGATSLVPTDCEPCNV